MAVRNVLLRLPRKMKAKVHDMLRLPRNLHFEVHKVLQLPRNLHFEVHKVLQLPRNLHFEVHKALRMPRNLHFEVHKALRLLQNFHFQHAGQNRSTSHRKTQVITVASNVVIRFGRQFHKKKLQMITLDTALKIFFERVQRYDFDFCPTPAA